MKARKKYIDPENTIERWECPYCKILFLYDDWVEKGDGEFCPSCAREVEINE